jgi:hypothetical protein
MKLKSEQMNLPKIFVNLLTMFNLMSKIIYIFKIVGFLFAGLFVTFFVYANLEPAPLHTHVAKANMLLIDLPTLDSVQLEATCAKIKTEIGVNTAVINKANHRLCVIYDDKKTSDLKLRKIIATPKNIEIAEVNFGSGADAGPQCPVPLTWLQTVEDLKYAICLR